MENVRDVGNGQWSATINGIYTAFNAVPGNRYYDEALKRGLAIADYVPPALTWADIRSKRDGLLAATDWWAVSDRAMSADETNYRQALRNVPQNFASPADVVWPTKPAA
jgi:hypothetical protein